MPKMLDHFEVIARNREGFNIRDAQIEIADSIHEFFRAPTDGADRATSLMIEAGTGTGKSLSYLVPLLSLGKKAIISTNTKALQRQVANEVDSLQDIYPNAVCRVLEGAANYACLLRSKNLAYDFIQNFTKKQLEEGGPGMIHQFRDKKGSKFRGDLWRMVATDSNLCHRRCPDFAPCFYQKAKTEAAEANVLVLNHDLLLLLYKQNTELFKEFSCIVIDEAHHFVDKARQRLGFSIGKKSLSKHFKMLNFKLTDSYGLKFQINVAKYDRLEEELFELVPEESESKTIEIKQFHDGILTRAQEIVDHIEDDIDILKEKSGSQKMLVSSDISRLNSIKHSIEKIFLEDNSNWLKTYTTGVKNNAAFQKFEALPLNVAQLLANFFAEKAVVMTSATLRSGEDFSFMQNQLGQYHSTGKHYPSPFDSKRVSVFIPPEEIEPRDEKYHEILAGHVLNIHTNMKGRSIFLCTNKEDLEGIRSLIPKEMKSQFLIQENTSQIPHMIQQLKAGGGISLIGMYALWEGIDVPGDALSCVCITRMPFVHPEDVLVAALKERFIQENDENDYGFFKHYDLPQMLLKLRQGFGRLRRHEDDTGLLAILDNRFMRRKYGRHVIDIIKEFPCYTEVTEAIANIPVNK